jgi:hypothetical protein
MTLSDWLPNALLLLLALLFGWHAPAEQRRQLLLCWALISLDWLTYVMAWTPYSIHFGLKALGLPVRNEDIWCLVDALTAAAIVGVAYERQWCWALWACLALQVVGHNLHELFGTPFEPYTRFLDKLFWGQVGCFLLVGGPGVSDRVAYYYRRFRDGLGSRSPVSAFRRAQ